jgi:hypothetical protein
MKIAFVDTEYTGEHALMTLVSVGLVTLDSEALYVTLDDYDSDQVTDWLRQHVLSQIDDASRVSKAEAFRRIASFLERYSAGAPVSLVSAGKATDLIQLFQVWHLAHPEKKHFHALYDLPDFLRHRAHFDLDTLFWAGGVDPNVDRETFVTTAAAAPGRRHDALRDALIVRDCFLKLIASGRLPFAPMIVAPARSAKT